MEIFAKKTVKIKEKRAPGRQPKFTQEYMMMVGRKVVEEGMTYRQAAKIFGISHGAVHSWKRMYLKKDWGNASKSNQVSSEMRLARLESQIRDLKHEIADLYLENTMLKK